jgi:hypothetical protein
MCSSPFAKTTKQKHIGAGSSQGDHVRTGSTALKRELQLAGYSKRTIDVYASQARRFSRRTACPLPQINLERIVPYLEDIADSIRQRSSCVFKLVNS